MTPGGTGDQIRSVGMNSQELSRGVRLSDLKLDQLRKNRWRLSQHSKMVIVAIRSLQKTELLRKLLELLPGVPTRIR
jgi:hypothetical protein